MMRGLAALLALLLASNAPPPAVTGSTISAMSPDGPILVDLFLPAGKAKGGVVLLHGTHGFAKEYLALGQSLAKSGYAVAVPCWFSPGRGAGLSRITPLECPPATPGLIAGDSAQAAARIDAVLDAAVAVTGVCRSAFALFGQSRGAVAALFYAQSSRRPAGLILNSSAYPPELFPHAGSPVSPLFVIHGARDAPDDGGSAMTSITRAEAFVTAMKGQKRSVQYKRFELGGHSSLFTSASQRRETLRLAIRFLDTHRVPC